MHTKPRAKPEAGLRALKLNKKTGTFNHQRRAKRPSHLDWGLESPQNPHTRKCALRSAGFPACGFRRLPSRLFMRPAYVHCPMAERGAMQFVLNRKAAASFCCFLAANGPVKANNDNGAGLTEIAPIRHSQRDLTEDPQRTEVGPKARCPMLDTGCSKNPSHPASRIQHPAFIPV